MIAYAFLNKVISFYSFYRYAHDPTNFFKMVAMVHLELEIFWSFLAIIVTKSATQVTKEVTFLKIITDAWQFQLIQNTILQGKKTSRIAHDIINRCHDSDINLMVRILFYFPIVQHCLVKNLFQFF